MPERLFSTVSISSIPIPALRERCAYTEGSMSPVRVPITRPSSGVSPMEVSTGSPPRTAEAEAPLPRWSTIWRSAEVSFPCAAKCAVTCSET